MMDRRAFIGGGVAAMAVGDLKPQRGSGVRPEIREKVVTLTKGQAAAMASNARVTAVIAGTRAGKTYVGPPWLLERIKEKGPGDYLVAAPSSPLLEMAAIPELCRYFGQELKLGHYVGSPIKVFRFDPVRARHLFGYAPDRPTQIYFRHANDPDSLEGGTFKAAWLDECGQKDFKLGSWEAIQRRLSMHEGRVLMTTTPYYIGWLKQQVCDRAESDPEHFAVVRMRTIDNPMFPVAEYERQRRLLPKWRFDMMYQGIFTRPAGLIYEDFDVDRHVVDDKSVAIESHWRRYVGVDFGGVNTAAVFLAECPRTERLYLYREYHAGNRTAKDHVEAFRKDEPTTPTRCVGGAKSEGQWRKEFTAAGYPIQEPDAPEVEVGINRVVSIIKRDRLRVFRSCSKTIDDLLAYSREVDDNGEPTEAIEDKETWHRLDALRYIGGWYATTMDRPALTRESFVVAKRETW